MAEIFEKMHPFIVPGLIYGMGCLGLAITFRYLRFPDFTILGSIMTGGITCIWTTNNSNLLLGICMGILSGCLLGFLTGFIISYLRIQPVLAGIITYTGAFSLGHSLSKGGTISLSKSEMSTLLSSVYRSSDAWLLIAIALALCAFFSFFIRTKPGMLLLGMTGSANFLRSRHRYQKSVMILTLCFSNSLVGFAGALYALKDRTAVVVSHADFLPISLGAIFGGNAVILWITRMLNKQRIDTLNPERTFSKSPGKLLKLIIEVIALEREDFGKIGILFITYVFGAVFLKILQGLVQSNAIIKIPFNFSHLIIALLIVFCVWWASARESQEG